MPTMGLFKWSAPVEPKNSRRVTETEDAAIRSDEPITLIVGRGSHAHDWLVQVEGARRSEELRFTEGEDASIGSREPIPAVVARCTRWPRSGT